MGKSFIVYFSQSGNTRKCAETLHSLMDSDLFELVPEIPYPRGYGRLLKETKKEAEEKADRELSPMPFKLSDYDCLFIGCPNWWSSLPAPVRTFMRETNLSGKAGSGEDIHERNESLWQGNRFLHHTRRKRRGECERRNKSIIALIITFSRHSIHLR